MQHILSASQFDAKQLNKFLKHTDVIRKAFETNRHKLAASHADTTVATLFYEPSTRTRLSFESAASKLGAGVISTENAGEYSSAAKGETLEDTIRTVSCYVDAIIIRHKETGAADRAAAVSSVPIINAGDGKGEHPTQGLLDMYTIWKEKGRLENLHVIIGGDLKHGRTVRTLARMLSLYKGNTLTFVSTPALAMGSDITDHLTQAGTAYTETDDLYAALPKADVVYWTRLQKERLTDASLESEFVIDQAALQLMKPDATIMHPLPRVGEIAESVDDDPRAAYFRQVKNGLFVRMALLDTLLT